MSTRRKKSINDISDEVFKAVIAHLENGGTKKAACEMLSVSSNATMERMVEEWKDLQILTAEMKKKKRGTPIEGVELANMIESYLQGDSFEEIATRNYRSTAMVKAVLERNGALLRVQGSVDPLNPPMIPDEAVSESFEVGEHVWVAGYQCIGEVMKVMDNPVGAYRVYLLSESTQQYVHVMFYELASVKHLEELGVNIKSLGYKWSKEDSYTLLNAAVASALKREKGDKNAR
ncbi:D2 protein [Pectobacterium phage DU_PP_V]|uniref:D2 protein n=1 Tax=Pectobacterium phage DU_PP_V TaxID=2041492 RepID=A0A2D2W7A2_9CAUD|nr:helicase [Pectobacterium phage DU_PP_V]ATS94070.1 D2 protein [Pectobacterium phage DU_PP_V]